MESLKNEIYSQLLVTYPTCVLDTDSKEDELILRLSAQDVDNVDDFKNVLCRITKTQWITKWQNLDPEKAVLWKSWSCQQSHRNKVSNSKRSANCKATLKMIIKKVNGNTKKKDRFLKRSPPLAVKVMLGLRHTHSINSSESLRILRVFEEVKKEFKDYFSFGMTPPQASMHHETKFLLDRNYVDMMNASLNPTKRQVSHLHQCWLSDNGGSSLLHLNPLERLKERIPFYNLNGSIIKIHDDADVWAVLLVSPIMKRAQSLPSSKAIVFVDSSCSGEKTSSALTILYTPTKAGAVPLAAFIHKSQTAENYLNAFMLLKDNFPGCFGGEDFPAIFMTEDSTAEKIALMSVWQQSAQLMCQFYVSQDEWNWLLYKDREIKIEEIFRLMTLFQNVMYSTSEEHLAENVAILQNEHQYPEFLPRFNALFERRKEWISLDRNSSSNRDINAFAETTVRIIKNIVLCRTKAFSIVALIEFCLEIWEKFFTKKFLECARSSDILSIFKPIHEESNDIKEKDVLQCASNVYTIKSETKSCTVNTELGVCDCPVGRVGAFCKHQCYLLLTNKLVLPSAPTTSIQEKCLLANLVSGENSPDSNVFQFVKTEITGFSLPSKDWESLPENKEYLPENKESFSESKESLPESKESFPEIKEPLPESNESLPENKESVPENIESCSEYKESLPENKESLPENKESLLENKESSPEVKVSQNFQPNDGRIPAPNSEMASDLNKRKLTYELNRVRRMVFKSNVTKTRLGHFLNILKSIKSPDDFDKLIFCNKGIPVISEAMQPKVITRIEKRVSSEITVLERTNASLKRKRIGN